MNADFYKSTMKESSIGYAYCKIICNENNIPYDYEFIDTNSELEKRTGLKGIDMIGKRVTKIFPKLSENEMNLIKIYGDIAIHGESKEIEEFSEVLGGWYRIKVYSPEKYYFIIYAIDISMEVAYLTELRKIKQIVEETELKYKTIIEYAYDWETWEDEENKLKYVSPVCEKISGYTVDEFLGNECLFDAIIIEEDKKIWTNHRNEICKGVGVHTEQFRIRNKDGKIIWIEHTCIPIIDKKGRYLGYHSSNHDITESKYAEEKLKENEQQFQRIIENLPFSLSIIGVDGNILYTNPRCLELFEVDQSVIGTQQVLSAWVDKEKRKVWLETIKEKGIVKDFEMHMQTINGKHFWAMGSGLIIKYKNQKCVLSTQHDITERKNMEQALKKREEEYRILFENAVEAIVVIQNGKLQICNPMAQVLTGYSKEELMSMSFLDLIYYKDQQRAIDIHNTRLKEDYYKGKQVFRFVRKNNEIRWMETNGIKINWNGKVAILNFVIDVTENKRAEDDLRKSEEKYRLLTENTSDVIWVLNVTKGKFTYMSPSILYLRGFTAQEAIKERLEEALTPESLEILMDSIAINTKKFIENPESPNYYINEVQQPCKNGDIIWTEVSTKYRYNGQEEIEIVGVSRNIEERKKSEKEVLYLSYHDQLTGLYNRRFYEEALIRLDIEKNFPISLVMADINGLKLTNDAFGHLAGDELLKTFATILKKKARTGDIIARTGGDEFVLLLPKTDDVQAANIVNCIKLAISKEKTDKTILSVSFGWDTKDNIEEDFEKIYMCAENNMYCKKLLESNSMKSETMKLITKSLYEKNAVEQQHCKRVSKICKDIGTALGLSSNVIDELGLLGLVHDIGKIGINEKILNKAEILTESEWVEIERHPEIGYQILKSVNEFAHIAEYVLSHHERVDGKGYPRNLKDTQIPLQSKILSIAEAYDTMTNDYPYKNTLSDIEAIKELKKNSNTQFDLQIAKVFVKKVLCEKWDSVF